LFIAATLDGYNDPSAHANNLTFQEAGWQPKHAGSSFPEGSATLFERNWSLGAKKEGR
jgi:hypothetical protein